MNYRLFRDDQIKSIKSSDTVKYTCESCGLYKSAYSPKMEPFGLYKLRILNIGEAPGCVHGDTLIETAFRDKSIYPEGIPIRELVGQSGFYVYSYDFEKSDITLGKVTKVWKTGWKKTYRVTYEWFKSVSGGRKRYVNSIVVTKNHPFLLRKRLPGKDPFRGKEAKLFNGSMHRRYLSIESGLGVGYSLQPFLYSLYNNRRSIGTAGSRRRKEAILLTEFKIGRRILPNGQENCHHKDENTLNDTWDNLECLTTEEHRRHHSTISNAMHNPVHRETHRKALAKESYKRKISGVMKKHLSDPENRKRRIEAIHANRDRISATLKNKYRTDPVFWYSYLKGLQKRCKRYPMTDAEVLRMFHERFPDHVPPDSNHKIVSIDELGYDDVYDMEVERYHNFAAHGIFVHNSTEDRRGKPFQGKAGTRLQDEYNRLGFSLFGDCLNINSANCRPTTGKKNRAPTPHELACCRVQVVNPTINRHKPHTIILLGGHAIESVIGQYWKKDLGTVSRWRGLTIPDQTLQAWICPVFHPSYAEREKHRPEVQTIWRQDLERALTTVDQKLPDFSNPRDQVVLLRGDDEIVPVLNRISRGGEDDLVAFDYETTGLKPQAEGHRIVCTSVATVNRAYAFMFDSDAVLQAWDQFLRSSIRKVAHNMKFEDVWSKVALDTQVQNWVWDTMLAAHVLDNRRAITALKFQVYINFGIADYDSVIAPYLEDTGKKKSGNAFNKIDQAIKDLGADVVLMYCGLDSLFTRKLAIKQMKLYK